MKYFIVLAFVFLASFSFAAETMKMNFKNEEITTLLENYSKVSHQKFIIDPTVQGKVTLLNPEPVSIEEAFNQISEALALNGYGIIKNDDVMTVRNARSVQRDNTEVYNTMPKAKPQRMVSWVISLKYVSANKVVSELRLFTSMYGEISVFGNNNQIIISDFTSNLQRVGELIKLIDIPQNSSVSKIVAQSAEKSNKKNTATEKTEN